MASRDPLTPTGVRYRCRGCGYPIEHLAAPRCPECGRAFDPADPMTYATENPALRRMTDLSVIALGMVTALLVIPVPWAALSQFRMVPGPRDSVIAWSAAFAGVSSFCFAYFWPALLMSRRAYLGGLTALPACAMLAATALQIQQVWSAAAALAGPIAAALLRNWLRSENTN